MLKESRIGISGGTFDPVHYGHLLIAETIREQFELDKVVFIPSGKPPHKLQGGVSDAEHRYTMVHRAISSNAFFEASRIELERNGFTYTVDTLEALRTAYGENTRLFFIIGADIVHDIINWRQPDRVFKLCEFIAVMRPGFNRSNFTAEIKALVTRYGARIHIAYAPLIDISSTVIRDRVSKGLSIKYLLPEPVESYITCNNLYR